jgi:hypothetical protein
VKEQRAVTRRSIGSLKRFGFDERAGARPLSKKRKPTSGGRLMFAGKVFLTTVGFFMKKYYR